MKSKELTALLERADTWPAAAQKELVELAREIEQGITGEYHATPEGLKAIDERSNGEKLRPPKRSRRYLQNIAVHEGRLFESSAHRA